MATIRDVVGFLCQNYKNKGDLSKARLTKMVYLGDWKSCIDRDRQITDIDWIFNNYGPYVEDVARMARQDPNFAVVSDLNMYGSYKETIVIKNSFKLTSLSRDEIRILSHVITMTEKLSWKEFMRLVYSTFPILVSDRNTSMNLPKLARRYKREMRSEKELA